MSSLMYLDRFCVSFAQSFIQEDLGLTSGEASYIISFFFWSYALGQIPSGWLSDRWGGRIMLTLYILSWSMFILLVGWSNSLWFLLAMQLGNGLSQAGAYPTSASLLSRWMPLGSRGIASSLVAFGGRFGGTLAPILTAWLIVFFVPVGTSSLLTPQQVFVTEIGKIGQNLRPESPEKSEKTPSPLISSMWRGLPDSTRALVQEIASRQDAIDLENAKPDAQPRSIEISTTEVAEFTDGLNAILKQPQLIPAEQIRGLKLTAQATNLMARREQGASLTQPETERLNRLILESVFPSGIGKVYVRGWRYVFTAYGFFGIGVALVFTLIARNRPAEHPWCNADELALINAGRVPVAASIAAPKLDWKRVLKSRSLWLSSISQYFTNIGWLFVVTQLPIYLEKVHHVEIIQRGNWTSMPMTAGMVGMLLGGRLTDWLALKLGIRWGRALPMGLTRFGAAAAYIGCIFTNDPWIATLLCCVVAFFQDLGVAATWAFVQDAGGRYVAVMLGFGNMWGNIGAAMAPQFYVLALDWGRNDWNVCFLMCASAMVISGTAAIFIDATKPIVPEEE